MSTSKIELVYINGKRYIIYNNKKIKLDSPYSDKYILSNLVKIAKRITKNKKTKSKSKKNSQTIKTINDKLNDKLQTKTSIEPTQLTFRRTTTIPPSTIQPKVYNNVPSFTSNIHPSQLNNQKMLETNVNLLEYKKNITEDKQKDIEKELLKNKSLVENLTEQRKKLTDDIKQKDLDMKLIDDRNLLINMENDRLEDENKELKIKQKELENEIKEKNNEIKELNIYLNNLTNDVELIMNELKDYEIKIKNKEQLIIEKDFKIKELKQDNNEKEEKFQKYLEEIKELEIEINELKEKRKYEFERFNKLANEKNVLHFEKDTLIKDVDKLKEEKRKLDLKIEELKDILVDEKNKNIDKDKKLDEEKNKSDFYKYLIKLNRGTLNIIADNYGINFNKINKPDLVQVITENINANNDYINAKLRMPKKEEEEEEKKKKEEKIKKIKDELKEKYLLDRDELEELAKKFNISLLKENGKYYKNINELINDLVNNEDFQNSNPNLFQFGAGKLNENKGLNNQQIDEFMLNYGKKGFKGTFAFDQIKDIPINKSDKSFSFILNLFPIKKEKGGHWVSVFITKDTIEYYDSFGEDPPKNFFNNLKPILKKFGNDETIYQLKINRTKFQKINTVNCGFFAIDFLLKRYKGESFKDATGFDIIEKSIQGEKNIKKLKKEIKDFDYIKLQ